VSPTIFLFKKKSLSRHKTPPLASHQKVDFFIYFFKKCFFFKSNETKQDIFSFAWNSLANFQLQFLKIRTEFVRLARACDGQSSSKVKSQDKMIFFFFFFQTKQEKKKIRRLCGDRDAIGGYIIIIYLQAEMRWAVTFASLCGYIFYFYFYFFLKGKK
jgi:hypothetical protein